MPHGVAHWGGQSGAVSVSHDLDAELAAVDAVLMLRVQAERMHGGFFPSAREYAVRYGLSERRMALLEEHAVVLHPGPMVRGMEITSAVADSPRTAVLAQVRNGVHIRMAVLYQLLAGSGLTGSEQGANE
jgi:aspartate carbamoyltransferase catalytic subunit